jgi:hypothetical protein
MLLQGNACGVRTSADLGVGHRAQEHIDADVPADKIECS